MANHRDGPSTALFAPVPAEGTVSWDALSTVGVSEQMADAVSEAPRGACVAWGIPFRIGRVIVLKDRVVQIDIPPTEAEWLVFMHTSDLRAIETGPDGFISPMRGEGRLAETAARYVLAYEDGEEQVVVVRRRHQVGAFSRRWGENCFEAVPDQKPHPRRASHEQTSGDWGRSQTRVNPGDRRPWLNWLWAWENPRPDEPLASIRFKPRAGVIVLSAISAGTASAHPLRWRSRRKACITLPEGEDFLPDLDEMGLLEQIQIDMGQVISATPRLLYPDSDWEDSFNNQLPQASDREVLVEYTAHPDACFHLSDGQVIPVCQVETREATEWLRPVQPATRRVTLSVVEKGQGTCVPAKLHVHGTASEYLAPLDRHRIANTAWFEDYSVDFVHQGTHTCTYIPGETTIDLPLGNVYVEVAKGFEFRPVRRVVTVTPKMEEITIEIEQELPWRENGWVTADTHVHFLSPTSGLLEGAAEGVNVVNLLASQWGELMTNVGDFDGETTWRSKEAWGGGEHLLRVGTENRQHVLGHISLLGYQGKIIAPMTTGGPAESALGDPIEVLLTEWARQCRKQGGLTVLPHFPDPRAEHAAAIVAGAIDAVEMRSLPYLHRGIDPYSLSDWYRYLNCGYLLPAVGGTDKMTVETAVGTVRTYARIARERPFTYESWMDAVRSGETFVTYGPLLEFSVDGQPMGTRIDMPDGGGTVDVTWEVASVTVPMTAVELVVNGEIRERAQVTPERGSGHWPVRLDRSSWLALLVRGRYPEQTEMIAAHSSPVMLMVDGSPMLAAADAVTILEQIEGALAYLDTVGTRADDRTYRRMQLTLTSAYRSLHNRMHQMGHYHDHNALTTHGEHGRQHSGGRGTQCR